MNQTSSAQTNSNSAQISIIKLDDNILKQKSVSSCENIDTIQGIDSIPINAVFEYNSDKLSYSFGKYKIFILSSMDTAKVDFSFATTTNPKEKRVLDYSLFTDGGMLACGDFLFNQVDNRLYAYYRGSLD